MRVAFVPQHDDINLWWEVVKVTIQKSQPSQNMRDRFCDSFLSNIMFQLHRLKGEQGRMARKYSFFFPSKNTMSTENHTIRKESESAGVTWGTLKHKM